MHIYGFVDFRPPPPRFELELQRKLCLNEEVRDVGELAVPNNSLKHNMTNTTRGFFNTQNDKHTHRISGLVKTHKNTK